jgi:hypothetical protein
MRILIAAVVIVAAGGCSRGAPVAPPRSEGEAAFTAQTAVDAPFLVLDLGAGRLDLYHGPALLSSFETSGAEVGRSRWSAWAAAAGAGLPAAGPWLPEGMSPTRRFESRVVRPAEVGGLDATGSDPSGSVDWIPPRPEELNPDPPLLRVRYAGGLTLELRADDAPPPRWELAADGDLVVRVSMSRSQLGRLFRSLPDSAALVVVAPPSA